MRSATSFFDKTLFRSQLKHTWPLWLGYTALWIFLVPVALFSALSAYQGGYSASDASYLLLNTGVRGGVFISFVFGLFFAMLAFSHLTQSRATNGFHALPVRRETIFLTAYLTGLFCQVSSILVTFLLGAAISAPLHLSFWSVTAAAMGSVMLEAVFFYSFAVLCMMMTGQILAAPVFYFVGNILVPGMEYLLRNFAGNFLYGYSGHADVALGFLSPPLYMYTEVDIASIETCESDSYYVTAYALEHRSLMILAAYALAGLAIALIALLLYRTRKSEMTGSTVAFPVGDAHLQVRRGVLYRRCPRAVPLLFPLRPVPFERQRFSARHDPLHGGGGACGLLCRRDAHQKELPRLPRGRKGRGHRFARSCAARRCDELRPHGL